MKIEDECWSECKLFGGHIHHSLLIIFDPLRIIYLKNCAIFKYIIKIYYVFTHQAIELALIEQILCLTRGY